jgi:hypothetical protein
MRASLMLRCNTAQDMLVMMSAPSLKREAGLHTRQAVAHA